MNYEWEELKTKCQLIGCALVIGGLLLSRCSTPNSTKLSNIPKGESNTNYDTGAHVVLEIDRKTVPISSSKKIGLVAPDGYKIVDFDYDRWDLFDYYDYVYKNDEVVYVEEPDKVGKAVRTTTMNNDFLPGEHVIANIEKKFAVFGQEDTTFCLEAPTGYIVLDYDYDKTTALEFENITYANCVTVSCNDINEFGIPLETIEDKNNTEDVFQIGEHKIVQIIKESNPWWGKNEMKQIVAPRGYKIIDYDYDKIEYSEYETITYENIVPVLAKNKDKFGDPLVDVKDNLSGIGEYEAYTHVLVRIDRKVNVFIGKEGTKQLLAPDGYELLDYDYDVNDDFEFETYVYINNKKIYLEDTTNFGLVIEDELAKKKMLVP